MNAIGQDPDRQSGASVKDHKSSENDISSGLLGALSPQFFEPFYSGLLALLTYHDLDAEAKSRVFQEILHISRDLWPETREMAFPAAYLKKKPPLVQYALLIRALHHLHIPFALDYVWTPSRNPLVLEAIVAEYPDSVRESMVLAYKKISLKTEWLPSLASWLSGTALRFPEDS